MKKIDVSDVKNYKYYNKAIKILLMCVLIYSSVMYYLSQDIYRAISPIIGVLIPIVMTFLFSKNIRTSILFDFKQLYIKLFCKRECNDDLICTCKTCIYLKRCENAYCYLEKCEDKKDWIDRIKNNN